MLAPLRVRAFRYQFSAQAVSVFGSTLSPVALSLGVLQLTGSTKAFSLVLAASSLPTVLFLLAGGVWADRLPRHKVMVTTNVICALTQAVMGTMLVTGRFNLGLAMGLQFITGTAMAFYFPSVVGLTSHTAPAEMLQQANALLSLVRSMAGSIGPLVASLLAVAGHAGWALIFQSMTFVVSARLLSRLTIPSRQQTTRNRFFLDLAKGFREVVGRSWVWSSIGVFMFTHLSTAFLMVLAPAMLLASGRSGLIWGGVIAALSVGQLLGDIAALRLTPRLPMLAARFVELLAAPLLFAFALGAPTWLLVAAAVFAGVALTFPDAMWLTALQQHLHPDTLSRVSSYDWMGSLSLRPIGYLTAAWLSSLIGPAQTLAVAGVLVVCSRIAGMLVPDVRRLTGLSAAPAQA